MQPWEIIQQLEAHNSRLQKESIIAQARDQNCSEFFHGVRLALDSLITFGVKQLPISDDNSQVPPGLMWGDFLDLVEQLCTRQLTGHAAQHAIEQAQKQATVTQWNDWYRRILIKDLRCGVSEKTVNKVAPGTVPVFTCALAHDSAKHESKMSGKKQIEIKLDGCLSEEWTVEFENGQKISIKEVVDSKLKGKIKSYNTITGKVEFNEILNWAVDGQDDNEDTYEWFEIELENGITLPPLTGNHLVYLPALKCYRRADLLNEGDEVLIDI